MQDDGQEVRFLALVHFIQDVDQSLDSIPLEATDDLINQLI